VRGDCGRRWRWVREWGLRDCLSPASMRQVSAAAGQVGIDLTGLREWVTYCCRAVLPGRVDLSMGHQIAAHAGKPVHHGSDLEIESVLRRLTPRHLSQLPPGGHVLNPNVCKRSRSWKVEPREIGIG